MMMFIDPEGLAPKITGVGQSGCFVAVHFQDEASAKEFAIIFNAARIEACKTPEERWRAGAAVAVEGVSQVE
jgi:hypothetical protein